MLETDACRLGVGAMLIQNNHLMCYFSKHFFPRMLATSTYVRELCAITSAVKKWRTYLLNNTLINDSSHSNTRATIQNLAKLLGYSYEIVYKCVV